MVGGTRERKVGSHEEEPNSRGLRALEELRRRSRALEAGIGAGRAQGGFGELVVAGVGRIELG